VLYIESKRLDFKTGKQTIDRRCYLTSFDPRQVDAAQLLTYVRGHWSIENRLHWCLDVCFREDESRVRKDHGPASPDHTFAEIGRGHRGIPVHGHWLEKNPNQAEARGKAAARFTDDGYIVEGYISVKALARPRLKAGHYVAVNFSINRGYDYARTQQWSMSKDKATGGYNRPDMWGDVMLLGSDVTARFVVSGGEDKLDIITPGESIKVEARTMT